MVSSLPTPDSITFDLDCLLVDACASTIESLHFFHKKGVILTAANLTHCLFPGTLELIQWLLREKIEFGFFSSGIRLRNEELINGLLSLATKNIKNSSSLPPIHILSREDKKERITKEEVKRLVHLFEPTAFVENIEQRLQPKSLLALNKPSIENCILVDDDPANIASNQLDNFLYVPSTYCSDFERLKNIEYKGIIFIKNGRIKDPNAFFKENPFRIVILKEFSLIYFQNQEGIVQSQQLNRKDHRDIIDKIELFEELSEEEQKEFSQIVIQKVKYWGEYPCNRIAYIAGMIFKARQIAQEESLSLSASLKQLQFKGTPVYQNTHQEDSFYLIGLKILQEINPLFEWNTFETFQEHSTIPETIEDEEFIHLLQLFNNQVHTKRLLYKKGAFSL